MNRRSWLAIVLLLLMELFLARYSPRALGYIDVPMALAVYCGWRGHPTQGAICGTVFGLIQDLLWKLPLGINGLAKTLIGFFSSLAGRFFMSEGVLVQLALLATMGLGNAVVFFALSSILNVALPPFYWRSSLAQVGLTSLAGVVIFGVLERLRRERQKSLIGRRFS